MDFVTNVLEITRTTSDDQGHDASLDAVFPGVEASLDIMRDATQGIREDDDVGLALGGLEPLVILGQLSDWNVEIAPTADEFREPIHQTCLIPSTRW